MIVTTGSFGTIEVDGFSIGWDTDNPVGDGPAGEGERYVLDGISASWQTDVLPPVAQPSTLTFRIYQNGPDAFGTWLPFGIGDPISVSAFAYDLDLGSLNLWHFKGRVADASGENHPAGGIVFSIVCTDRLADLTSTNAPPIVTLETIGESDVFLMYDALAADAEIDLDYHAGESSPDADWSTWHPVIAGLENVSTYDALSTAIMHDVRAGVARYLTQQIDTGTSDPEADARYRLEEWDPANVDDLAGVVGFHWTGAEWTLIANDDYYATGAGMVLRASNLARNVGRWTQTRDKAVNTVELTYFTDAQATTSSVMRRQFADLVTAYGRNTRSVPSWLIDSLPDEIAAMGDYLLLDRSQVQTTGFGFEAVTVAYETLDEDQRLLWADELFSIFGTQPVGRPFAVVDVPDHWRLADGPVIAGRVMGVTLTMQGGAVRFTIASRAIPPSAAEGVTIDEIGSFGPAQATFNNVDPTVTIDSTALAGHSAI